MRKDILERMKILKQDNIKPNYAELDKQSECDYRMVKRYYENDINLSIMRKFIPSILDPYKEIVEDKLQIPC